MSTSKIFERLSKGVVPLTRTLSASPSPTTITMTKRELSNFSLASAFFKGLNDLVNPKINKEITKLKRIETVFRMDGRTPDLFVSQGMKRRVPIYTIENTRKDDLIKYVNFNDKPFGFGACTSFSDLMTFRKDNLSLTNESHAYTMIGSGIDVNALLLEAGIDESDRTYENEFLVLDTVHPSLFLSGIAPKSMLAFMDDRIVQNEAFVINPLLPKAISREDLYSIRNIFKWLDDNHAEEMGFRYAKAMFQMTPSERVARILDNDLYLTSLVETAKKTTFSDLDNETGLPLVEALDEEEDQNEDNERPTF